MAFTSGLKSAGSDNGHDVELHVKGLVRHLALYNRPGDDYKQNKGDLWKIDLDDFNFPTRFTCIKITDIEDVYIVEGSNDGWNIDSIVTLVKNVHGRGQILSCNLDVFRWIDGNGASSHKRFRLTKV